MKNLEKLQNRRKAVIYISSGYDFNPFEQAPPRRAVARRNGNVREARRTCRAIRIRSRTSKLSQALAEATWCASWRS